MERLNKAVNKLLKHFPPGAQKSGWGKCRGDVVSGAIEKKAAKQGKPTNVSGAANTKYTK